MRAETVLAEAVNWAADSAGITQHLFSVNPSAAAPLYFSDKRKAEKKSAMGQGANDENLQQYGPNFILPPVYFLLTLL